ncbi:MAG TPA: VanZ family protein [Candidatus Hydrogenedentes bacterium]|nr:VanZ family protein [Candidatus Hydrogenedentota bacterium]
MKPRYSIAVLLYCAAIFWLSAQPMTIRPELEIPGLDKAVHTVLYAGLAVLVSVGMRRSGQNYSPRVQLLFPIAFCLMYGITDEIHQLFTPHRSFQLSDIFFDTFGPILAQFVLCAGFWKIQIK